MLAIPSIRYNPGRKPTGAKLALKPVHVWGIRIRLQVACKARDLALFDLALDSKLRGCDLVSLKVGDILSAGGVKRRVVILQQKTGRPVQFEVTEQARRSIAHWIEAKGLTAEDWLFPSRMKAGAHLSTRQYARLVDKWVALVGLDPAAYGTRSMRRTKSRCFTRRPATSEPVSSCWGTRNWKARSATSESKWTMPWSFQRRLNSNPRLFARFPQADLFRLCSRHVIWRRCPRNMSAQLPISSASKRPLGSSARAVATPGQ